ncbi:MAG: TetR/AcrR family transcriptional regulator [Lachnospiraceae bacterium]|nr:TetR/AcrR family transcriptional regulator [Lachnospiraceae bacterium]
MGKKGNETKQHIKEQAKILFAEKGFKVVTMKDICEATGLSRGGLYRHYDGTDRVFSEIISEFLDVQNDIFSESIEKKVSASEILNVIFNTYQSEMLDKKRSLSMAIYEYFSSKDIAESENMLLKQYQLSLDCWDKLIKYGISRGEFKCVDTKGVFDLILFSYQGVRMYSQLMPIQQETPMRIFEQIKQILLK